jgi:hypothetical protein
MSLLKLRQDVWNAEEKFEEIDSDEPRDELGDRRRYRALRETRNARNALMLYYEKVRLIGYICVQYNLPAGDPCWLAEYISSFV